MSPVSVVEQLDAGLEFPGPGCRRRGLSRRHRLCSAYVYERGALKCRRFPRSPRSDGFALIELLTVIAVLAILMGILLPGFQHARRLATRVVCQSNLRQIGTGVMMYANDHRGHPPAVAPHELGGAQGTVSEEDPWLPAKMFGGTLKAECRPLNAYLKQPEVFRSPCDRGEPLWWFDTQAYQSTATAYELYGSSYFYASGYNRMAGVMVPMGIAKFVGTEFSCGRFASDPLPLGHTVPLEFYGYPTKKVVVGSIPIHRTMTGVVAPNPRAQWYLPDPDHLWANAVFADGHAEFVKVFPYDAEYQGISTLPDPTNPYY